MAVIDKEKIRKKAKKEPFFKPVCTICRKPIDVEEDGWQAVERNRGQITWICKECMREGFRLRGTSRGGNTTNAN